jgi:hypothetical protein
MVDAEGPAYDARVATSNKNFSLGICVFLVVATPESAYYPGEF